MKDPVWWIIIAAALTLVCTFSCVLFTAPPETYLKRAHAKKPYDLIIVPGYPYDSSTGKWNDLMKIRVYWSYYLYKNGYASNVMYSGGSVYTPYIESKIMAMYGKGIGIDEQHIFTEERAEHSTENIYYSYQLAKKHGFKTIAVATDPYQSKLLRSYCSNTKNLDVDFIPIVYDSLEAMKMEDIDIEAETARAKQFVSLLERESKWKRFKGTLGFNIIKIEDTVPVRKHIHD
ncbi:MAG: YdcF family protein [Cytophagales bacterium]|nr:YdcF family protein [Cytophaga sp.]